MEAELKCATMEPIVQCVMMDGQTVMLLWSAIKKDTAITVSISLIFSLMAIELSLQTAPEATFGSAFGLSDEAPVLQNLMCNGTEYYISDCPGYDLNNVTGDYCLSGNYQAGVRCVNGRTYTFMKLSVNCFFKPYSAYTNNTLL